MSRSNNRIRGVVRAILMCASTAAMATPLFAQTAPANDAAAPASSDQIQEVVVTGYRVSLKEATDAKKAAVGITDSIFAEDIGKFPDTNIAESFNRIPGITISRDINGEGVDISIRGLGTDFTKVLLNGAPIAIASTGPTDAQNTNREVDLNMFPTELFSQLSVYKTSSPDLIEGGAAGTVSMRSARAFDTPGAHVTAGIQGTKNQQASSPGERGYMIASDTFSNGFGALFGFVGIHNNVDIPGFETIGWTNPHLSATQCTGTCNTTGGGNWSIPGTVPTNAGNGLTPGATIDQAFLLANNPGLTIAQINNAIIPRLGRNSDESGQRDRDNAVLSFEFKPNDQMHAYLDSMWGWEHNDEQRIDMDWVGRNGAGIPLNTKVDNATPGCTAGCVVTSATYANSQFFLEYRPYVENTYFWNTNPGFEWTINDKFSFDVQGNYSQSRFHRESPTVLPITAGNSGLTVSYTNTGIDPSIASNVDLDNPANFIWNGGRVNIQDERRITSTRGARANFTWSQSDLLNVKVGAAFDRIARNINAYDNSQAWQNAVCGDNPNVSLPGPNTQPACAGLSVTGAAPAGYPTYPGLGTGYSSGIAPGSLLYKGSLIPVGNLASFLKPGPNGFITVNWPAFMAASNYAAFHNSEAFAGSSNTGASGGYVNEDTTGVYLELTGSTNIADHQLRYVGGVRWVDTDQMIGGFISLPDPRNAATPAPLDGAKYPNITDFNLTDHKYSNLLPSFEAAYNITDQWVFRGAVSRTLTRPNPNAMLPGLSFTDPSAATGNIGNPALQPYLSDNIDLGLDFYTGQEGYLSLTWFRKHITGFTSNGNSTEPFSFLAPYGITYDTLTPTQQTAITSRGGPSAATVVLTEQVNASGVLTDNGLEFGWVQPLDFLIGRFGLEGFGYQFNYTLVDQIGTGAAPAIALGVPPHTYNLMFYYDHKGVTLRVSTVYNAANQISTANQNGITTAALFQDTYQQWDFSSIFDMGKIFNLSGPAGNVQLTLDCTNFTAERLRQYFEFPNATFTDYNPGRTYTVGLRARF
ncbi:MAG TPA: TonB-dependent receptor [Steroidobacteraceae bacterium]|nr:TonB-dependent receptor [Steroidobacteraceae bacterium]